MKNTTANDTCINCGKSENDAPLLQIKFKGEQMWICSGCMPVLIHKPEQLMEQLISINNIDLGSPA